MARRDPNRLLVQDGFRHFRRTYSLKEVRYGLLVLAVLVAISVWIGWRGTLRPAELYGAVELSGSASKGVDGSAVAKVIPAPLIDESWSERERSEFDSENLYEKINGRADFFTSKGFERLYFVSLTAQDNPEQVIDLELYDMGSTAGALSAFTAERSEGADVTESGGSQYYRARNALFVVRGPYYGRALGADESTETIAALSAVRHSLEAALAGSERSWALELFVDGLGFDANVVSFVGSRAFSLEVANNMWIASLDGDAEIFVSVRASDELAAAEAAAIVEGFASYGTLAAGDPPLVTDEFLGGLSSAVGRGPFIIGVRAAADADIAKKQLARLAAAVASMSPELLKRAVAAASPSNSDESGRSPGDDEALLDGSANPAQTEAAAVGEETY